ncbi:MAG: hypothetical protein WCR30_03250 [Clostridia bacterium]
MMMKKLALIFVISAMLFASVFFPLPFFQIESLQASSSLVYVALGDSISSGYMLDNSQINPFCESIQERLELGFGTTTLYNEAVDGFNSSELLTYLNNSQIQSKLAIADVITISVGLDDILTDFLTNYSSFVNNSMAEEDFRLPLQLATDNFSFNLSKIVSKVSSLTKSSVKISILNVFNPYKGLANKNLGSIFEEYVVMINNLISNISNLKFEIIDIKAGFDLLSLEEHQLLFSNVLPAYTLNNNGQTQVYEISYTNMEVLNGSFQFVLSLAHSGELIQTYASTSDILFSLSSSQIISAGTVVSWYVNNALVLSQADALTYTYSPSAEGTFVVKASVGSDFTSEIVTVSYEELTSLSMTFDGILYQNLGNLSPITFSAILPSGCDPNTVINWYINSALTEANEQGDLVFEPSEVGEFVVRVESPTCFEEKTITIAYAPISDFEFTHTGNLNQVLGSLSEIIFAVNFSENCNPNIQIEWSVNDEVQENVLSNFTFTPASVGSYEIKAKIGEVIKIKTAKISYATITDFMLVSEGELVQQLGSTEAVVFALQLPSFADPSTTAEWSINGYVQSQMSNTLSITPSVVGDYVIEAKIGEITKSETIELTYVPIVLSGQNLTYNGSQTQYLQDLQPVMFTIEVGDYSNASEIKWYVNNVLVQTTGNTFWFVPEEVGRFLVVAKLGSGESCNPVIVSVFAEGGTTVNLYGTIFFALSGLTILLFLIIILTRLRKRPTII